MRTLPDLRAYSLGMQMPWYKRDIPAVEMWAYEKSPPTKTYCARIGVVDEWLTRREG